MPVKKGDKVKVEYTGTLEDGTVFDSSEKHGEPLAFEVGAGQMIKGFDDAVVGMEVGDEKEITLKPADAYGDPNPQLIQKVPKDKLPKDADMKEGMQLAMALPNGQQIPATITEIGDTEVTIDINHPLAGKTLNFKLKLIDVS
ncbi:MAG: peptidylprolyl isomerase [Candidatus Aenigmarchaeota archaeon]|nr:peptidylprolyl isomerase [Candidatus Aenigmarchaeota archaeon]